MVSYIIEPVADMSKMKNNRVKRIFTWVLCVSLTVSLYARPRTVQQAQQIANEFTGSAGNLNKTMGASTRLAYTRSGDSQPLFYVFNRDAGFIIVSADDRAPEILSYSDAGPFDVDNLSDNFRYLLNTYAAELELLAATPEVIVFPEKEVERSTQTMGKSVVPLLGSIILWDQRYLYNLQCPVMGDGGRSVVGCVATAMAQIMEYHQWPEKGTGTIPGYTTRSQDLVIDEENIGNTYYDWEHITPVYTSESTVYFTLSTPTGLDEVDGVAGDLAVYPNPVQEVLHVRQAGEVIDVTVYDLSGRELLRPTPAPGEELQVPVADLQAGTYLLRVRTAQEVKTTQFIKK